MKNLQTRRPLKAVLDFQAFKDDNNEFILKEVCMIDVESGTVMLHRLARPPFDFSILSETKRRECRWLTKHYHGLDWNDGDTSYAELQQMLRKCLANCHTVYVKGIEKKEFVINNLINNIVIKKTTTVSDLSELGCESLPELTTNPNAIRCGLHGDLQHRCALTHCMVLRSWILNTDTNNSKTYSTPSSCCICRSCRCNIIVIPPYHAA